jgi:hypothetical protein
MDGCLPIQVSRSCHGVAVFLAQGRYPIIFSHARVYITPAFSGTQKSTSPLPSSPAGRPPVSLPLIIPRFLSLHTCAAIWGGCSRTPGSPLRLISWRGGLEGGERWQGLCRTCACSPELSAKPPLSRRACCRAIDPKPRTAGDYFTGGKPTCFLMCSISCSRCCWA